MAVMHTLLTSPSSRTVTPRALIDIDPTCAGAAAPSTSTAANPLSPAAAGGTANSPRRASLRQYDSRRNGTRWRSATSHFLHRRP